MILTLTLNATFFFTEYLNDASLWQLFIDTLLYLVTVRYLAHRSYDISHPRITNPHY